MQQQAPLRHQRLASIVALADDQRLLLRGEVEAVLVGLRDGDLEAFANRPPPLT
jgi:hypothetical protein